VRCGPELAVDPLQSRMDGRVPKGRPKRRPPAVTCSRTRARKVRLPAEGNCGDRTLIEMVDEGADDEPTGGGKARAHKCERGSSRAQ